MCKVRGNIKSLIGEANMGVFATDVGQEAVLELVALWCDQKGFLIGAQRERHLEDKTAVTIEAHASSERSISAVRWCIYTKSGKTVVDVDVKLNTVLSVLISLLACASVILFFYAFFSLSTISNTLFGAVVLLGFSLGLSFLLIARWLEKRQMECENSFWRLVPRKEILCNIRAHIAPDRFFLVFPSIASVLLLVFLYVNSALLLGLWCCGFGGCYAIVAVLAASMRDRYSRWKVLMSHLTNRWIAVCFWAVVPLGLLGAVNGLVMLPLKNPEGLSNRVGIVSQEILNTAFSTEALTRNSRALEEENLEIFKVFVAKSVRIIRGTEAEPAELDKKVRTIAAFLLLCIGGFGLRGLLVWRRLLLSGKEWGRMMGYGNKPKKIVPPPTHLELEKKHRLLPLGIVIHFLLGSVITIATMLISFDAVCYVFLRRTVVFDGLGVLYAWVFSLGNIILPAGLSQVIGNGLLLVIAFPSIVFFSKALQRAMKFLFSGVESVQRKKSIPLSPLAVKKLEEVQKFMGTVCKEFDLSTPAVVIEEKSKQPICIRGSLIRQTSTLSINRNMLDNLTLEELKAAVAHELGHLAQGLKKTEWLKLLSVMAMYSNYYLMLIIDAIRYEIEADKFAIRAKIAPDALVRAITKAGIPGLDDVTSQQYQASGKIIRGLEKVLRVRGVAMVMEFFFAEGLVGYTHPVLAQRMQYLYGTKTAVADVEKAGCGME